MENVAVAKSTSDFQIGQSGGGKKYQNLSLFVMQLSATLSISTRDFQKWTNWQFAKSGLAAFHDFFPHACDFIINLVLIIFLVLKICLSRACIDLGLKVHVEYRSRILKSWKNLI